MFTIEEFPQQTVAFMRNIGPYGAANKELMENLKKWVVTHDLLCGDSIYYGIACDDPTFTPPEKCRYDVCITIPPHFSLPDTQAQKTELLGGRYAVFELPHTAEAMSETWNTIFPSLAVQGCQFDNQRFIMERYSTPKLALHLCEICVPIH